MVTLFTERFLLRELTASDASQCYLHWFKDAEIKKYILNPPNCLTELSNYIQGDLENENAFLLGIFTKEEGKHLGNIRFEYTYDGYDGVGMGIIIGDKKWRGKSVASEVIEKGSYYLKERFGTQNIFLGVDSANVGAIRAYEKLGFKVKKTILVESSTQTGLLMVWNLQT